MWGSLPEMVLDLNYGFRGVPCLCFTVCTLYRLVHFCHISQWKRVKGCRFVLLICLLEVTHGPSAQLVLCELVYMYLVPTDQKT